jgi:glucokinase
MSTGTTATFRLVADIGGSNARFGLLRASEHSPIETRTLSTADFPTFAEAVEAYLLQCGSPTIEAAAVAIANPVVGDRIQMTNHHWSFSIEQTRQHLGLKRLVFLNDFAALALSLPEIPAQDLRQIGGHDSVASAPRVLVGPGTGLGVSTLVPLAGNQWIAVAGEGGHVTIAATNEQEEKIIAFCRREFGHVSAERLLSGMGLSNLYHAISCLANGTYLPLTPAEVTERGLSGKDPHCVDALSVFCSLLGSAAGNLALTLGAHGGVYIGGGIVPRLGEYFHRSAFRCSFEAKGRFAEYLAGIPAYVIHAQNPALIGAAIALDTNAVGHSCSA